MKSWSLVKRWVFYQALITGLILLFSVLSVKNLVQFGVGEGIKASVQTLKPQIISLSGSNLEGFFLKNQPPFVGLYNPDGQSIYLPEDDLPQTISDIIIKKGLFENKYLIYTERLDNGYYLLGFTSQERMFFIEKYITKSVIILMCLLFMASSYVAYYNLKKLYKPIEKLSRQMNLAIDHMAPLEMSSKEIVDPKISRLIEVFNQLITTIKAQFSKLDQKQKQQKMILETLEEGILVLTDHQHIKFVNTQGHFYLKTKESHDTSELLSRSVIGQKILELLDPEIAKPIKEKCQDNHKFYEITVKKILDSQQLVVIYDETDRIQKLEAGKNFISNASHELRTPITIIKGFAEALSDKEALSHMSLDEVMPKILSACDRMDALIKRLLLLADVDQRHVELTNFDLALCLKQEVAMFKNLDPSSTIVYQGPSTCLFHGDEDLLKIVFSNLLSNALKYSQDPKQIEVTLSSAKDQVMIQFQDNGIGIPESDLERVFERFYRVDKARTRKMGGAGLGLSLVKTIIDKHQGTVQVTSEIGKGSIFTVCLPLL